MKQGNAIYLHNKNISAYSLNFFKFEKRMSRKGENTAWIWEVILFKLNGTVYSALISYYIPPYDILLMIVLPFVK